MSNRDMFRKETKKPKKSSKKAAISEAVTTSPEVEIIRKKRKTAPAD